MRFNRIKEHQAQVGAQLLRGAALPPTGYVKKLGALRQQKEAPQKHVLIIGAGISGLASAYELEKMGYRISILEALGDHVGGRVRTLREGDLHAELGAMRIPDSHYLTHHYIQEFGIETRHFVQNNPDTFAYFRGTKSKRSPEGIEALKKLYQLTKEEQNMTGDDMWEKAIIDCLAQLTEEEKQDLYRATPTQENILNLDQKSLYNRLRNTGLSTEAIDFVTSAYGVSTYLPTGLTEHIREEHDEVWLGAFQEIVGGMDLLAKSFEDRLQVKITKNARVFKLSNTVEGATVYYRNEKDEEFEVSADWVICTIPLGVLSRMDIQEAFSEQKINAIRNVNYDASSKVLALSKSRFWEREDHIYGGGSIWDSTMGHTWYPSDNAQERDPKKTEKPAFFLASYTWGQYARRVDNIPEGELTPYIKTQLKKIHPHMADDEIQKTVHWSWSAFPWSAGAFAFFNPGNHTDFMEALRTPDGHILLAGEHCSFTHSWIQGALESSIDVCQLITKA